MVLARQNGLGPTRFGRRIAYLRREFERNPDRPSLEMAQNIQRTRRRWFKIFRKDREATEDAKQAEAGKWAEDSR